MTNFNPFTNQVFQKLIIELNLNVFEHRPYARHIFLLAAELELGVPGYRPKDVDTASPNNQKFPELQLLLHGLTLPVITYSRNTGTRQKENIVFFNRFLRRFSDSFKQQ